MSNRLNVPRAARVEPAHGEQYIMHECSQLRDEIWTRVKDQRTTETYMLLACAVMCRRCWRFSPPGAGARTCD